MVSAPQMLHGHAGSSAHPTTRGDPATCWVCGLPAPRTMARSRWMGAKFVGQDRVRSPASGHVCEPCVWVMAGRPPDTFRMTSHLFGEGVGWWRPNKADKPAILAFLRRAHDRPWFACVSDTGQKHLVPWAPVNPPGARGRIIFEEAIIHLPDVPGWKMVDDIRELLTAGATKAEVDRGEYGPGAWSRCRESIFAFEAGWSRLRRSSWFGLALWLDRAGIQSTRLTPHAMKSSLRVSLKMIVSTVWRLGT